MRAFWRSRSRKHVTTPLLQQTVTFGDRSASASIFAARTRGTTSRSAHSDLAGRTMTPALHKGNKRVRGVVDEDSNAGREELFDLLEELRDDSAKG